MKRDAKGIGECKGNVIEIRLSAILDMGTASLSTRSFR